MKFNVLILVLCSLLTLGCAEAKNCEFHEMNRTKAEHPYVYEKNELPWVVTVDELNGKVTVQNVRSKTACTISLDSVRMVYGRPDAIVLRAIEISSDDLFFADPTTCKEIRKPVHLGISPSGDANSSKKLRQLGICSVASKK